MTPIRRSRIFGAHPDRTLIWVAFFLGLIFLARVFVLMPVLISGESMVPLLRDRQIVLINKLAYTLRPPSRGDVVVVRFGGRLLTKRVVGLPGEEVSMAGGTILIDGAPLPESYVRRKGDWDIKKGNLGDQKYLVVGDNRTTSRSLRTFAVVHKRDIIGNVIHFSPFTGSECEE